MPPWSHRARPPWPTPPVRPRPSAHPSDGNAGLPSLTLRGGTKQAVYFDSRRGDAEEEESELRSDWQAEAYPTKAAENESELRSEGQARRHVPLAATKNQ